MNGLFSLTWKVLEAWSRIMKQSLEHEVRHCSEFCKNCEKSYHWKCAHVRLSFADEAGITACYVGETYMRDVWAYQHCWSTKTREALEQIPQSRVGFKFPSELSILQRLPWVSSLQFTQHKSTRHQSHPQATLTKRNHQTYEGTLEINPRQGPFNSAHRKCH